MKRLNHSISWFGLSMTGLLIWLLVGCSTTFVYRHADWLVLWKVDHYLDLTKDQKTFLRGRIKEILTRHRREALPVYEDFLREVKMKSADGLSREEVDWMVSTYQHLRADLLNRIVADSGLLFASVDEGQVRNLEEAFRDDNEKADRLVKESQEVRFTKRATATLDWLSDWLGSLTKDQKQRIVHLSRSLPDIQPTWLELQKLRQQDALHVLRSTRDPKIISQHLQGWMVFPENHTPPRYLQAMEDMRNAGKEMALTIDRMITPQQRTRALAKLQDLINDIHDLSES